jgi:acyl carrier protein
MTRNEFHRLIEQVIEADPGTIKGGEMLANIPAWDSMAVIGFIAMLDKHLGITVPASSIMEARSIEDLTKLAGNKITG